MKHRNPVVKKYKQGQVPQVWGAAHKQEFAAATSRARSSNDGRPSGRPRSRRGTAAALHTNDEDQRQASPGIVNSALARVLCSEWRKCMPAHKAVLRQILHPDAKGGHLDAGENISRRGTAAALHNHDDDQVRSLPPCDILTCRSARKSIFDVGGFWCPVDPAGPPPQRQASPGIADSALARVLYFQWRKCIPAGSDMASWWHPSGPAPGAGSPAGIQFHKKNSGFRLSGGTTRVPYPTLMGCQRTWKQLFWRPNDQF
eukprot:gene23116-biopygen19310